MSAKGERWACPRRATSSGIVVTRFDRHGFERHYQFVQILRVASWCGGVKHYEFWTVGASEVTR